ncbi:MAG: hypothetical protein H6733_17495 [Alphaproteobacteria bacterium]|nr:hypothetical protein [Alphaproteobacteria bacterium]
MKAWLLLLALGAASASASDDLLAPTLEDLDRGLARAERLLDDADTAMDGLATAEAAWVTEGCVANRCAFDRALQLVVASRSAGHDARDLVQSARAELTRVHRMASFDAVRPLVDTRRQQRMERLDARAGTVSEAWSVRTAWYVRFVEPWARRNATAVARACVPDDPPPAVEAGKR